MSGRLTDHRSDICTITSTLDPFYLYNNKYPMAGVWPVDRPSIRYLVRGRRPLPVSGREDGKGREEEVVKCGRRGIARLV